MQPHFTINSDILIVSLWPLRHQQIIYHIYVYVQVKKVSRMRDRFGAKDICIIGIERGLFSKDDGAGIYAPGTARVAFLKVYIYPTPAYYIL